VGRKNHCLPVNKSLMALLLCTWLVKSLPMRQLSIKSNYREVYILICCALSSTQITNSIVLEAFNHSKFHSRVTPISSIYCIVPKEIATNYSKRKLSGFSKKLQNIFQKSSRIVYNLSNLAKDGLKNLHFWFSIAARRPQKFISQTNHKLAFTLFFINSTKNLVMFVIQSLE
jgi:hypothetical protein